MMTSALSRFKFLITLGMAIFLCACGSEQKKSLLENIPADARLVATVNLKNIALKSGCDVSSDGTIRLSENLENMLEQADVATQSALSILCAEAPYVNSECVVLFSPKEGDDRIVMAEITNHEQLEQSLSKLSTASATNAGFRIYAFPECVAMVHGDILWISRNPTLVIDTEASVGDDHFAAFNPVKEFLTTDPHDLEVVLNNGSNVSPEFQYVLTQTDFKSGGIYSEFTFMDAEGNMYEFNNVFHSVERELLQYVPTNTQILLSIGEVMNWEAIFKSIDENIPKSTLGEYATVLMMAKSYLSCIDGTTLVALAPIAGKQALKDLSLDTWQVLFMTHMPQEQSDELLSMGQSLLEMQGLKSVEVEEGNWTVAWGHNQINYGLTNGYLYASNYDIQNGGNTNLATAYEGKRAVAELMIPYGSETMKALDLPWGVDFNLFLSNRHFVVVLRLPGSNGPVLKELIDWFTTSDKEERNLL